jgi:hypothetical protein
LKRAIKRALAHGVAIESLRHLIKKENDMFEFDPNSTSSAWPTGQYEATIEKTEEGASKAGAPMLTVTYRVYHPQGKDQAITDYFVKPSDGKQGNLFKLKALCEALGADVLAAFKSGKLDHKKMLRGRNVLLGLAIETDPKYGEKNKADSYTKLEREVLSKTGTDDEEVPF